jgi:multiple sugar transport system substrate-binding protein
MTGIRRIAGLFVAASLVATACGSNDQQGGASGSAGASQPAGSGAASGGTGGDVSGELTVWAMGNEGALLGSMADLFMEEYPDVTVNVTPVDWGQAVAKLQTAIGGGETPDVSQMGTDMMAQFAATGALEAVPDTFAADTFFESAWNTNVVDDTTYGVPWYVETRVLYYRTDLAEEAGITAAPETWDDLKAAAQAMKDGGADWGISRPQECAGVPAVRLVERGRHRRRGRRDLRPRLPRGGRGPDLLRLLLRGGADPRRGSGRL